MLYPCLSNSCTVAGAETRPAPVSKQPSVTYHASAKPRLIPHPSQMGGGCYSDQWCHGQQNEHDGHNEETARHPTCSICMVDRGNNMKIPGTDAGWATGWCGRLLWVAHVRSRSLQAHVQDSSCWSCSLLTGSTFLQLSQSAISAMPAQT